MSKKEKNSKPVAGANEVEEPPEWLSRVQFRIVAPTDILEIFELEKASWSKEERASKNSLQYRQHHAAPFFRCAVLTREHEEDADAAEQEAEEEPIIGFVCSTRCDLKANGTRAHDPNCSSLWIHSIVVKEEYRRHGLGTRMMKDYLRAIREFNVSAENAIARIRLKARESLLTFCIQAGFSKIQPVAVPKGADRRYQLELELQQSSMMARENLSASFKSRGRECYILDSFASSSGSGNPAAVVLLPKESDPEALAPWMQTVAAEFNLSETVFIWPRNEAEPQSKELHWNIRYFTPKVEMPLCGHATLASAAILYQTFENKRDCRIVFHATKDNLTMELAEPLEVEDDSRLSTRVTMEFPAKPPVELTTRDDLMAARMMLESAFSCNFEPLYVGRSDTGDILIELTPEAFHDIGYEEINFKALLEWDGYYRGVIVCCTFPEEKKEEEDSEDDIEKESKPSPDFLSRFFGPKAGINEDPVTGSAHCVLGPYYAQKLGKEMVMGKQASERGGIVECAVTQEKVRLTGRAVLTVSGTVWI